MYFSWHAKLVNLLKFVISIIVGIFLLGAILLHKPGASQTYVPMTHKQESACERQLKVKTC
jgi:hypothetical protein